MAKINVEILVSQRVLIRNGLAVLVMVAMLVAAPMVIRKLQLMSAVTFEHSLILLTGIIYQFAALVFGVCIGLAGYVITGRRTSFNWPVILIQGVPALVLAIPAVIYFCLPIFDKTPIWLMVLGTHSTPLIAGIWLGVVLIATFVMRQRNKKASLLRSVSLNLITTMVMLTAIYLIHLTHQVISIAMHMESSSPLNLPFFPYVFYLLIGVALTLTVHDFRKLRWNPDWSLLLIHILPALVLALLTRWYISMSHTKNLLIPIFYYNGVGFFEIVVGIWLGKVLIECLFANPPRSNCLLTV